MKILGIDIGGSALKGAVVDPKNGKLLEERFRIETPGRVSPKEMAEIVEEIRLHFHYRGKIGIGFPGVIQNDVAQTAANLDKRFIGQDLGQLFGGSTGCPVHILNDADAAGLAEMRFGAGRGHEGVVLLLTLGTGVGSAVFNRGILCPNTEFGHFPFHGDDAEKRVAASVRKNLDLSWHKWGKELDEYLGILEKVLWPELIILGGGVSSKSDQFFKYLKRRTPIVPASFHNEAGIVGAAMAAASGRK
jgi:polyphosphate glucokinase